MVKSAKVADKKTNSKVKSNSLSDLTYPNNFTLAGILPTNTGYTVDALTVIEASTQPYLFSNNYWVLNYLYKNDGIVQTFIDQPVEDAFRGGIIVDTSDEEFSAPEIQEVYDWIDENGLLKTYCLAEKWSRLFGGGAVIVSNGKKLDTDFDINKVEKGASIQFSDANLWDLGERETNQYYKGLNTDATTGKGLFSFDTKLKPFKPDPKDKAPYYFYGQNLSASRVVIVMGKEAPTQLRVFFRGWGMSVIERIIRPLANFYKLNDLMANYIDQAKIDIFKFVGLNDAFMDDGGAAAVKTKVAIAGIMKGIGNGMALDKEDDFIQKQISFTGVPEFKEQNRIELASALQFPVNKLWGTGSKAFSSGEDDIENYNAMIESTIREPSKIKLVPLVKLAFQVVHGRYPKKLRIKFHSLRMLSAPEEASMKATRLDTILRLYDRGIINKDEVIKQANAAQVLPNEVNAKDQTDDFPLLPPDKPKLDLYGDDSRERNKLFKI